MAKKKRHMKKPKDKDKDSESSVVSIDMMDLAKESQKQPDLVYNYTQLLADAKLKRDEAKDHVALVRAELDRDIRAEPEDFEIGKLTETVVEQTIICQGEYREALTAMRQAQHEVEKLYAITNSLEHRKKSLEHLVYLHGQGYFA